MDRINFLKTNKKRHFVLQVFESENTKVYVETKEKHRFSPHTKASSVEDPKIGPHFLGHLRKNVPYYAYSEVQL